MARPTLTAVPAQRSSLPLLKVRRRALIGALCVASVSGVVSTVAWLTTPTPPVTALPARDEHAISLATILADDFVAGRDSAVPAAAGIDTAFSHQTSGAFTGAQVSFAGSKQYREGDKVVATFEKVQFHVAVHGKSEQIYQLTVPMLLTGSGWVVGAAPALEPVNLSPSSTKGLDYGDLFTSGGDTSALAQLPYAAAVNTQVQRWATAFASGGAGSKDLFALTGDTNAKHLYDGLGGWGVRSVTVKSFTQGPNSSQRSGTFGATWLSVRVALVLTPPAADGPTLNTEYDLLLEPGLNSAQPPVTAWGPAGTGPTSALTDYSNAHG